MWDDEQNEEFLDRPEETMLDKNKQPMQSAPVQVQTYRPSNIPAEPTHVQPARPIRSVPEQSENVALLESIGFDEESEEDFTDVLHDANKRIEQGRLYQMIMNHNLFEGMDADPEAVQNVQREIRKFAKERMEVMLGMRRETAKIEHLEIDFPFNELEVDILKKLAYTATKGMTANSDNYVPEVRRTVEEVPVVKEPKRTTLNPIGGSTALKRPMPMPTKQSRPLQSAPKAPIKRTKMDLTIDQICAEEGISRDMLEENYQPLGKPPESLSEQELLDRAKETAKRVGARKTVKSTSALPMATAEQQEMLAMSRATQIAASPGMAALLAKVGLTNNP